MGSTAGAVRQQDHQSPVAPRVLSPLERPTSSHRRCNTITAQGTALGKREKGRGSLKGFAIILLAHTIRKVRAGKVSPTREGPGGIVVENLEMVLFFEGVNYAG